jgi:tetratricopeptide (TPR) repeat protein
MAEGFQLRGNEEFKARQFAKALASYEEGVTVAGEGARRATLLNNSAAALIELGRYSEALERADAALAAAAGDDEPFRRKVEARQQRARELLALRSRPSFDAAVTPAVFFPSFEYFPVGHDVPQDVLKLAEGEYRLPEEHSRASLGSRLVAGEPSERRTVRALLAASSDPRHVLQSLSMLAIDVGKMCRAFGIDDPRPAFVKNIFSEDVKPRLQQFCGEPLVAEIQVNDLVPEVGTKV